MLKKCLIIYERKSRNCFMLKPLIDTIFNLSLKITFKDTFLMLIERQLIIFESTKLLLDNFFFIKISFVFISF